MLKFSSHNRKWVCRLLTIALLLMGITSFASWQCQDGKLCDETCKMQHGLKRSAVAGPAFSQIRCSHCSLSSSISLPSRYYGKSGCSSSSSQCIMHVSERPASNVYESMKWFLPLFSMPPPVIVVSSITIKTVSITTALLSFYPQRFLRVIAGRAPPITC